MKKKGKRRKKSNNNNNNKKTDIKKHNRKQTTKTKTKKIDKRPSFHVIINGKHAIYFLFYFLFLKRFIDILFVKAVQCISL